MIPTGEKLGPYEIRSFSAGGMGEVFILKPLSEETPTPITVVLNWTASLRK